MNIRIPRRILALPRRTLPVASAAVLAAAAVSAALAAPASAAPAGGPGCVIQLNYDVSMAQSDNCPGNGAVSWAWLNAPKSSAIGESLVQDTLYVYFANGGTANFTAGAGTTNTSNFNSSITGIKICETWDQIAFPNPLYVVRCSPVAATS